VNKEFYQERKKCWKNYFFPLILKSIDDDIKNYCIFIYSQYCRNLPFSDGNRSTELHNKKKERQILSIGRKITREELHEILEVEAQG